jgi:hypothetical protein
MLSCIRKSLELKIIIALTAIFACIVGIYTVVDMQMIRDDTVRASEQSLSALAESIKKRVNTAMSRGLHQETGRLLEEASIPNVIDRVAIYDENGFVLQQAAAGADRGGTSGAPPISSAILSMIAGGDKTILSKTRDAYSLSYFSPIANRAECFRCHGNRARLNGILRLDISLRGIDALIASRRNRNLIWTGIMSAALLAALVILLRTLVHKPVKVLRDAMASAAEGNENSFLAVHGDDELAELNRNFVVIGPMSGRKRNWQGARKSCASALNCRPCSMPCRTVCSLWTGISILFRATPAHMSCCRGCGRWGGAFLAAR